MSIFTKLFPDYSSCPWVTHTVRLRVDGGGKGVIFEADILSIKAMIGSLLANHTPVASSHPCSNWYRTEMKFEPGDIEAIHIGQRLPLSIIWTEPGPGLKRLLTEYVAGAQAENPSGVVITAKRAAL